jgi:hypothetical protein
MKYISFFIITYTCFTLDDQSNYNFMVRRIIDEIKLIVTSNMNQTIYKEYVLKYPSCHEQLNQIIASNYTDPIVNNIIYNSGKGLTDLGMERICIRSGLDYYLIRFNLNLQFYYGDDDKSIDLYTFLQQFNFYTGFCLPPQCENFYRKFSKHYLNPPFYKYLSTFGIRGMSLFHTDMNNYESPYFIPTVWLIFSYILLTILISTVGLFYYKKDDIIHNDSISIHSEFSDSSWRTHQKKHVGMFRTNVVKKDKTNKDIFYRVYKNFSVRSNMKSLFDFSNNLYNDQGLEIICFMKFYVLFWLTYNHNIYTLINIPHRDYSTNHFITSFWFFIVKYSIYAIDCWIVLDGLIFAYKLMCFLKKTNDYSFKNFLIFYCSIVSKVIVFFIIFFLLYINFNDIGRLIGKTSLFEYFFGTMNNRMCRQNPVLMLIPFYIQYLNPIKTMSGCYRHFYILQNELICMTFMLIIIYLGFRFKTKTFDYIILCSMPLLVLSNYLYIDEATNTIVMDKYTYFLFAGNTLHYRKTHLFFYQYYVGMITGMIYFYYKDVISQNPMETTEEYLPFSYTSVIMKSFDSMNSAFKYATLYLSIFAQLIICFSYHIFRAIFAENGTMAFTMNDFVLTWFLIDKFIFVLLFMVMLLSFLVYPKQTFFKPLVETTFFIPIYRTSFCYFNILNSLVYLFYSVYSLQIYFNYQNTIFMTIGLIIIQLFISFILQILFEIPLKRLVRIVLKRNNKI